MCAISTVWKNKLSSACNHLWIFLSTQDFQLTFQHFSICQWPEWVMASAPDNDYVVVHDEGSVIASISTAGAFVVKVVGKDHEAKINGVFQTSCWQNAPRQVVLSATRCKIAAHDFHRRSPALRSAQRGSAVVSLPKRRKEFKRFDKLL